MEASPKPSPTRTPFESRVSQFLGIASGKDHASMVPGEMPFIENLEVVQDRLVSRPGVALVGVSLQPISMPVSRHVHRHDGNEVIFLQDSNNRVWYSSDGVSWNTVFDEAGEGTILSSTPISFVSVGADVYVYSASGNRCIISDAGSYEMRALGLDLPEFTRYVNVVDSTNGFTQRSTFWYAIESVIKVGDVVVRSSSPISLSYSYTVSAGHAIKVVFDSGLLGSSEVTHVRLWRSMDAISNAGSRSELYLAKEVAKAAFVTTPTITDNTPDADLGELILAEDMNLKRLPNSAFAALVAGRIFLGGCAGLDECDVIYTSPMPSATSDLYRPIADVKSFRGSDSSPIVGLVSFYGDLLGVKSNRLMRLASGNVANQAEECGQGVGVSNWRKMTLLPSVGLLCVCSDGLLRVLTSSLEWSSSFTRYDLSKGDFAFTGYSVVHGSSIYLEMPASVKGGAYSANFIHVDIGTGLFSKLTYGIPENTRLLLIPMLDRLLGLCMTAKPSCWRLDTDDAHRGVDWLDSIGTSKRNVPWSFASHPIRQDDGFAELWSVGALITSSGVPVVSSYSNGRVWRSPVACEAGFIDGNSWVGDGFSHTLLWTGRNSSGSEKAFRCVGSLVHVVVEGSGYAKVQSLVLNGVVQTGQMKPGWDPWKMKAEWEALNG